MTNARIRNELLNIEASLCVIHSWVENEGLVVQEGTTEAFILDAMEAVKKAIISNNTDGINQLKK
jgi:uncharacterized protein YqcC (DUF446 family)